MAKVEKSSIILEKAKYLSNKGEKFILTKINNSLKLESEWFGNSSSSANRNIPQIELGFIRRIKNYINKNEIYNNFMEKFYYPMDIMYVDIQKQLPKTSFDNVVEIDIDEAYWKTAYNFKVISTELYKEGSKENKKISKLGRLISLGSLAKKEVSYSYNGSKLVRTKITRSILTENIWYSICKRVSDVMFEAKKIAGEDFIMYWVDGIYIKYNEDLIKKITEMFKEFDYDVKIKKNLSVEYSSDCIFIKDLDSKDPENSTRQFFLSKNSKKRNYFTDQELKKTALKYSKYGAVDDLDY